MALQRIDAGLMLAEASESVLSNLHALANTAWTA